VQINSQSGSRRCDDVLGSAGIYASVDAAQGSRAARRGATKPIFRSAVGLPVRHAKVRLAAGAGRVRSRSTYRKAVSRGSNAQIAGRFELYRACPVRVPAVPARAFGSGSGALQRLGILVPGENRRTLVLRGSRLTEQWGDWRTCRAKQHQRCAAAGIGHETVDGDQREANHSPRSQNRLSRSTVQNAATLPIA